jgi:hypothetical protein
VLAARSSDMSKPCSRAATSVGARRCRVDGLPDHRCLTES